MRGQVATHGRQDALFEHLAAVGLLLADRTADRLMPPARVNVVAVASLLHLHADLVGEEPTAPRRLGELLGGSLPPFGLLEQVADQLRFSLTGMLSETFSHELPPLPKQLASR